jgi:hypothetical protein
MPSPIEFMLGSKAEKCDCKAISTALKVTSYNVNHPPWERIFNQLFE